MAARVFAGRTDTLKGIPVDRLVNGLEVHPAKKRTFAAVFFPIE